MIYGNKIVGTVGVMGGIPTVYRDFALAFADMVEFNRANWLAPNEQVKRVWATVSTHEVARNGLAGEREGDWTFFLDCDVSFPPDCLARLCRTLEETGADVACAPYFFGGPPYNPVLYLWNEEFDDFVRLGKWDAEGPFSIAGAGAGCLLVKNVVFDRVEQAFPEMGGPFGIWGKYRTDDLPFFWKCRKLGVPMVCDPRIRVEHLRVRGIGIEDHLAHLNNVELVRFEEAS